MENTETTEQAPRESRLAAEWLSRIQEAEIHWDDDFTRMSEDIRFAEGIQWPGQTKVGADDRYVANITLNHVRNRVSALFARNPRVVAKRRHILDFEIWDERPESLMAAMEGFSDAMNSGDREAAMGFETLLADYQQAIERRKLMEKIGRTLEVVTHYELDQANPTFKVRMKQCVRRAVTTGVGYVKVGYRRAGEPRPENVDEPDETDRQRTMQAIAMAAEKGEIKDEEATRERLLAMMNRQAQPVIQEGITFDFPCSRSLIVDPNCKTLVGFCGAGWIAERFNLTKEQIIEIYGVSILGSAKDAQGRETGNLPRPVGRDLDDDRVRDKAEGENMFAVYELWNKVDGTVATLTDGHPDWLREPMAPDQTVDGFWPYFALTFNDVESEHTIFPPSDVRLIRHQQKELNRARQALREHRIANRPRMFVAKGALTKEDIDNLESAPANSVIQINHLDPGKPIDNFLQAFKPPGIDPNLYEVNPVIQDLMTTVGTSEATLGNPGTNVSATGEAIAEGSRMTDVKSSIDDLDNFLTALMRATGQILLSNMSPETARQIAGPGALWPRLTGQQISDELLLEVMAGSSGRPNRATEIANFREVVPLLIQIPGVSPYYLARKGLELMDDNLDLTDAIAHGIPSITQMNSMKGPDPGAEGAQGAQGGPQGASNAEKPPEGETTQGSVSTRDTGAMARAGRGEASQGAAVA